MQPQPFKHPFFRCRQLLGLSDPGQGGDDKRVLCNRNFIQ